MRDESERSGAPLGSLSLPALCPGVGVGRGDFMKRQRAARRRPGGSMRKKGERQPQCSETTPPMT
jgi:hypothetical protein